MSTPPASPRGDRAKRALRHVLRPVLLMAVVVVVAFGYARLDGPGRHAPHPGDEAPAFRLPALGGGEHALADERGRVVVLNFWASWCPPCVAELPSLAALERALADEGVSVLAVSTDVDGEALARFVAEHRLGLRVLRDPGGQTAARAYGVDAYPETFVIDPDGRVREHVLGPARWDSPEWRARLRRLLAGGPPPR